MRLIAPSLTMNAATLSLNMGQDNFEKYLADVADFTINESFPMKQIVAAAKSSSTLWIEMCDTAWGEKDVKTAKVVAMSSDFRWRTLLSNAPSGTHTPAGRCFMSIARSGFIGQGRASATGVGDDIHV